MNKNLIPSALARLDWQQRHYHCISPSGGPYPRSDFGGDKRNWGPNFPHGNYLHIRQEAARFISESGMKSFPSPSVIERAIPRDRRWPLDNSTWKLHWGDLDNTVRGDDLLDEACVKFFGEAETLEARVRLSQFAQAYGTRLLIEQCRRQKARCGGILLWKTADQWPGCDQGIVDYAGVLRPVYHSIQQAFSEVIVSISQGFGSSENTIGWWVVSDRNAPLRGSLTARVFSLTTSTTRHLATKNLVLPANGSKLIFEMPVDAFDPEEEILTGAFHGTSPAPGEDAEIASWYALDPKTALRYHEHRLSRHHKKNVLT